MTLGSNTTPPPVRADGVCDFGAGGLTITGARLSDCNPYGDPTNPQSLCPQPKVGSFSALYNDTGRVTSSPDSAWYKVGDQARGRARQFPLRSSRLACDTHSSGAPAYPLGQGGLLPACTSHLCAPIMPSNAGPPHYSLKFIRSD